VSLEALLAVAEYLVVGQFENAPHAALISR
jgi:hypothetical protein